jgi:TP901 family phage tail tape measure protein
LTAAINSFNKEGINHAEVVNRMANVDAAFAVSSADLAEAISRAGAVAQSSGVSFNQLSAVITAVQQRTARGGSVIGNGFKSIFTRIKRSGVRDSLEEIGVATKNLDGSFRSSMDVILDYANVYKTLSDSQKAYTSEQLAGVYQIQNLQALLQDLNSGFSVYNQALKVANNTTDEATRRNEQLNVTLDALFKQSKLSAQELAASLGEVALSGNFKEILTFLDGLAQKLNSLLSEEGGSNLAKNLVRGIGSFITGPGLVILGAAFIKIFGLVTKFAKEAFADILGINSETKRQQSLQAAIGQILSTNAGVYQKILAAGSNTAKQEQIILNLIKQETAERIKQEALIKRIAASSRLVGVGASEQGYVPMGRRSSRVKGKKTLGMANGFFPAFAKENSDIYNGVGGARKNDKAVRTKIKTTPGRSSDVVVNTGEWVVKNFQGSGADAVFNRDMAKSYGLPEGAKKVTAASGFMPNFSKGKVGKFHNENISYTARELGAFSGTTGKSNLSKFADNSDRFTGRLKVSRMKHDNAYFKQTGVDIKNNLIVRDQKFFERTGKIKYNVNQEYKQSLYKKYGDLLKGGVYSGIFTHAENISKSKPYTGPQPRNMRRAFGGLVDKAKGLEGERQGKIFLSGKKGLEDVRYAKSNDFFDLKAEKKLPGGFKRSSLYENKATEKQNIVEVLKKGANRYLSNLVGMQKSWGAEPIGIKNNKLDHVNLTQGKGAAMRGGLNLITAKDTSLYKSKITNSANKKNTVIQKDNNYAKGFVPNFADARNRYQKIKDVLADPANKNMKFNSPSYKEMSIQTVKKGMGGEFQKMWLESYLKKGGGSDYQMLLKMGYDPDQLAKLRKHYERGGPVNIKTLAQGFIPNLSAGGVLTKKGLITPQQINRIRQGKNAKNKETGEQLYLGKFSTEDQKKILAFEAKFSKNVMATQKQETKNKRNKLKTIDASRQATMLVATNNLRRKVDSTITPKGGEKTRLKYRAEGIKSSVLKGTESGLRERMENSMIRESQNLAREISGGGQFSANNPVIKKIANAGSIGSASGAVFETALSSIGNNKLFTKNNATFDISGFPDGRLQKLFGYYTPFADAKIGISADTKRDFNEKLLKLPSVRQNINKQQTKEQGRTAASTRKKFGGPSNLAGGYIPNFALSKPQKQFLVNNNFARNHREAGKNFTELDYFYITEKNMSLAELKRQREFDKKANLMTGVSRYAGAGETQSKRFGAGLQDENRRQSITSRANMRTAGAASITDFFGKKIDERIFGVPVNIGKGLTARLPRKQADSYIDKKGALMLEMQNNSSSIMSILNGGAGPGYLDELKALERNAEIIKIKKEALDDFYKKQAKRLEPSRSRYTRKGNSVRPIARRGRGMPNFASFFKGVRKRQQGGFYNKVELQALEKAKKGVNERGGITLRDGKILDNDMPFGQLSARDLDLLTTNLVKFGGISSNLAKKVYDNYIKNAASLNKAKIKQRGDMYDWGRGVSVGRGYKKQRDGSPDFLRTSRINAAAGGFLPNFALSEAIARESNALKQRGISSNKIKVEKSSILKSESNPMGIAVTNTVDEPMGVQQGINRSIKEGRDPKTYGVPSFASRQLTAEERELERKKADFRLEEEKRRESRKGRSSLFNPYADMDIDEAFDLDRKQKKHKSKTRRMGKIKGLRKHGMSPIAKKRMKALSGMGQNAAMGAMFMGPMAAEMIRDGREEDAVGGGGRMGMDLMNSAAMGAAFGPKGMAIGAAAGLASGMANYSNRDNQAKTFESLEMAKKNLDKQFADVSSIQGFGQSISELQQATELGDVKGIIAANKQIRKSISSIADPEIKKRMNEIASSGMSTSEKLGLVSQALEKLGTDAEINSQLIKVGKTANSEKNMGPNSLQNSIVGDLVQDFFVDAVGDFQQLTGGGRNDEFTKLAFSGKDNFLFKEAEGKDFAKQTGDLLQKEIEQISSQKILKDLSTGKVQFGNFDLKGLSSEEIARKRSGGGEGSLELDARIKEFEDEYIQDLLGKTSLDLINGNIAKSEVGKSIAKRDGGNETLSNIERLTTKSKEDGGGLYTGGAMLLGELTSALRESKDSVADHSEAIAAAVNRQNEIANLEQKLIQEYQAMIQAQQAVSNMMSNFESNERVSDYRAETNEIASRGANDFLTKRNYIDPSNYVERDANISRNSVVRESISSLNAQLLSEISNAINMDALYDPDQTAKQQLQVPDDDLTGRAAVNQEIAEASRQSDRAMATAFAQFAAQNQDGNITLDETKALIQQLKSTGDKGNQISQMANNLEKSNNKEIIAKLERISVNTLLQKGELASGNLSRQGNKLLGDSELRTGAQLAIAGSDGDGSAAATSIKSQLEADPSSSIDFNNPEAPGEVGYGPATDEAAETINALRLLADQMGISQQMFTGMNDDMANYIVAMANVENQLKAIEAFDSDTADKMRSVFEQVKANLQKDYETTQEVAKKLKEIALKSDGIDPTLVKDPVDRLNVNLSNLWDSGLQITNMTEVSTPLESINEGISELVALGGGGSSGDGSFAEAVSALSSSVEELTSLPEKMNEQLSQLVINHEVKGGITFDFNSDAVRSQLTPAMEEGLKSILQEGIILDYLATALAPRIKLDQMPN